MKALQGVQARMMLGAQLTQRRGMGRYANLSGDSGAVAYATGPDWIDVVFRGGQRYRYSYRSAGRENVEQMKELARAGKGLTTFISRVVREGYERRGK